MHPCWWESVLQWRCFVVKHSGVWTLILPLLVLTSFYDFSLTVPHACLQSYWSLPSLYSRAALFHKLWKNLFIFIHAKPWFVYSPNKGWVICYAGQKGTKQQLKLFFKVFVSLWLQMILVCSRTHLSIIVFESLPDQWFPIINQIVIINPGRQQNKSVKLQRKTILLTHWFQYHFSVVRRSHRIVF